MTCTLTTPIAVPNVTRWRVLAPPVLSDDGTQAVVRVRFDSPPASGRRLGPFEILARNTGTSVGLALAAAPEKFDDMVTSVYLTVPNAADTIEAAYRGAGTKAAALRAVEAALLSTGLVAAALTGAVS